MEPNVLIIMGMGGLMCFMFIIMAVIWLSGSDDEGTESGTGSDNSGSDNSGSDNSGSDNSGSDNSGSDNSGSDNSGDNLFNADGTSRGTQSENDAKEAAEKVGLHEEAVSSQKCKSGYVSFKGRCYPICEDYGGEGERYYRATKGSSGGTSGCGTTNAGSGTETKHETMIANQEAKCDETYSLTTQPGHDTGYTLCEWSANRCRNKEIACIPINAAGSTADAQDLKIPKCPDMVWQYGNKITTLGSGGREEWSEVGKENTGCFCDGSITSHSCDGEDCYYDNTWRCEE